MKKPPTYSRKVQELLDASVYDMDFEFMKETGFKFQNDAPDASKMLKVNRKTAKEAARIALRAAVSLHK